MRPWRAINALQVSPNTLQVSNLLACHSFYVLQVNTSSASRDFLGGEFPFERLGLSPIVIGRRCYSRKGKTRLPHLLTLCRSNANELCHRKSGTFHATLLHGVVIQKYKWNAADPITPPRGGGAYPILYIMNRTISFFQRNSTFDNIRKRTVAVHAAACPKPFITGPTLLGSCFIGVDELHFKDLLLVGCLG